MQFALLDCRASIAQGEIDYVTYTMLYLIVLPDTL